LLTCGKCKTCSIRDTCDVKSIFTEGEVDGVKEELLAQKKVSGLKVIGVVKRTSFPVIGTDSLN